MSIISVNLFKKLETVEPSLREVLVAILEEIEKQQKERVTKDELKELKEVVADLGEAQKKTEQRLNELAEAQKKTEQRLNELAEAQKKTEQEIYKLVRRMDMFEERLEGISHSVGYSLENKTYKALPKILSQRYNITVIDRLVRKYFLIERKNIQINIYGHGKRNGEDMVIIGECKVRPSKREITRFKRYAQKIADAEKKSPFYIFVAHDFPPDIEEFLKSSEIPYVWSYELE